MKARDLTSRDSSMPIRGSIVGLNYDDYTYRDIELSMNLSSGDTMNYFRWRDKNNIYSAPIMGSVKVVPLRILKPHYGYISQCYLSMKLTPDTADSDLTMRVAIGKLSDTRTYSPVTTYTDIEVLTDWRKIVGSDIPITVVNGSIAINDMDITPVLPQYGDAKYNQEMFVLLLAFNKVPQQTSNFHLNYINLMMSVTGAL